MSLYFICSKNSKESSNSRLVSNNSVAQDRVQINVNVSKKGKIETS